ncbi:SDR family NAD(P)-dependent oxidoreductase [Streptomyces sp. NPDC006186]|uniref:SDR family NAD(P)-dependent oxidoreductase n=1 Tax=Streptomyces sp. NPDC006186 TaxID=3155248 RepID=UPI0033B1B8FE
MQTMAEFPTFDVTGRVALVTGAARGLGRAIALTLAHAGADVVLGLLRPGSADDLVRRVEAMGRRALAVPMDVSDLEDTPGEETVPCRAPWHRNNRTGSTPAATRSKSRTASTGRG